MSNERLRAALMTAGLNLQDFSAKLGVDPKTVERWITTERIPHRTHRLSAAAILGKGEEFLWPETQFDQRARSASQAEFVALYTNRGSLPPGTWSSLIDDSTEAIDLLALAASFLHDTVPDFVDRLAVRARRGVRVRLLFGDPSASAVATRGAEEGIGELLAARCRLTWSYFKPLCNEPGVLAREHGSTLYNSVFRFDDTLLANPHTLGSPASHSPVLHLHRIPGGRLFAHYMAGYERTWERAREVAW